MLLTPLLFILYDKVIAPRYSKVQAREMDEMPDESHIIIAGRGRVGGIVDRMLRAAGFQSTVIDYSSKQLDMLKRYGIVHAYYGDATRPDLLHSAGIANAKLLIVTIDNKQEINALVKYVLHHYPNLHVIARAVDRDHVYDLWAHGCRDIIRETYDSSLRIGRSAYEALGVSRATAMKMKDEFNDSDAQAMIEVAGAHDVNIPALENEAYVAKVRKIIAEWEPQVQKRVTDIMNSDSED